MTDIARGGCPRPLLAWLAALRLMSAAPRLRNHVKNLNQGSTMKLETRYLTMPILLVLAGCGGGGGSSDDAAPASGPGSTPQGFAGTAYLKQQVTQTLPGEDYGSSRRMLQLQIDQCNDERDTKYALPAVAPVESELANVDVSIHDRYFDGDKAALHVTKEAVDLRDWSRWLGEAVGGALPTVPPDCAAISKSESKGAFLWRDGVMYILNITAKMGWADRSTGDFTPKPLATEAELQALPTRTILGERCYVVNGAAAIPFAAQEACVWDRFPATVYVGMPWALTSEQVTEDKEETAITLEISKEMPIDASVFEIPDDITVSDA